MKTELRYCKCCKKDTRHDVFKDGLIEGEKADTFERGLFAVLTFGLSEMVSDRWARCQICDKQIRI